MIARSPKYARWADGQPGGINNPLGTKVVLNPKSKAGTVH